MKDWELWNKAIQGAINDALRKSNTGGINCSWDSDYGNSAGYGKGYLDNYYSPPKAKRKHQFSPVLLVFSTVYNCDHCGAKKEDCKTEYCDGKDDLDIGDWG